MISAWLQSTALVALALSSTPISSTAQEPPTLEWYFAGEPNHDPDFPRPEAVLGWQVGSWHASHDQLVRWFEVVAEFSDRVVLEPYARSHEQRPLFLAVVTHPDNHARLEQLRGAHVAAALSGDLDHDGPEVVWMGYSVHGNEPSGGNAAMLLAWHLAAGRGEDLERFLRETIVLIDPCLNPDGFQRFAGWVNSHRGRELVGDPASREHREVWPGGRTNHYWFDLNRDWLLLTHPESRGRVAAFHRWMPQVLTDFHEMGTDSTYFFQPGIPSRRNPLTPEENVRLTERIADFHAEALDELGVLYYSEEDFDDFYYGKGSTYPDLHGGVGILFEQASSRGHLQDNSFGGIDFPTTIRNQLATSLSTLRAVDALRDELDWQRRFYASAAQAASESPVAGYVFGERGDDPERVRAMARTLVRHGIEVLAGPIELTLEAGSGRERRFSQEHSFLVPGDQPQTRLVRALFETRTSWADNTFYDVSTWHLPSAYGVDHEPLTRPLSDGPYERRGDAWTRVGQDDLQPPAGRLIGDADGGAAWVLDWRQAGAAAALADLLEAGLRARVATRPLTVARSGVLAELAPGAILVPLGVQDRTRPEVAALVADVAAARSVDFEVLASGSTLRGIDLGSPEVRSLESPRPLLVVGDRVSGYEAGEVWHQLDLRWGIGLSMVERDRLADLDLSDYTHLLLVSGSTSGLEPEDVERVAAWVREGGVVIASRDACGWAATELLEPRAEGSDDGDGGGDEPAPEAADAAPVERLRYADHDRLQAVDRIAGAIFSVELDPTHPLCFGFPRERVEVFRSSSALLDEGDDPFAMPARYGDSPLVSGYASEANVQRIAGTAAIRAERLGDGAVVCLMDNPLFRGYWRGAERFYANALFFASVLDRTGPLEGPSFER